MALYDPTRGPDEPDPPELLYCHDCEGEFEAHDMGTPQLCKECDAHLTRMQEARCRAGTCEHVDANGRATCAAERIG